MARYLAYRLVALIPTVFGVVLMTFVLFNVVGGSPAAVILGERATALSLEFFDEARGFNKPLLYGRWTSTRALPDSTFTEGHGVWAALDGIRYQTGDDHETEAGLAWDAPVELRLPLAFGLRESTVYRLDVSGYGVAETALTLVDKTDPLSPREWVATPHGRFSRRRMGVAFATGPSGVAPGALVLRLGGSHGRLTSIRLRRGMAGHFDSQLAHYFRQLWHLDFGTSHVTNRPVLSMLRDGLGPSLALTVPIMTGSLVFSLVLALGCAAGRGRMADRLLVWLSVVLMSVNYIVWVVIGQYVLAYRLGWFPVWGFASWRYLLLPLGIGMATTLGRDLRFYRTVMLEEMHRLYVRTAQAKGLTHWGILLRHVLPNGLVSVVANVGVSIPFLFTGSLLLETFFGIPGVGRMGIEAIYQADFDVVRALVLLGSMIYVLSNLLTDLAYLWVDPRMRLC